MPDEPKRIYWDACVFLHYIEGTQEWMPILDSLLEEASETKGLVIFSSTISITEVAFAKTEKDGKALDPNVEAAIDALWNDRSAVKLVEYNETIAREARRFLRQAVQAGRSLKSMDSIHLATAANRKVQDFHTTDGPLKNVTWAGLGFSIRDPFTQKPKLFTS
jgi:predicted nucleic acid-binding protein